MNLKLVGYIIFIAAWAMSIVGMLIFPFNPRIEWPKTSTEQVYVSVLLALLAIAFTLMMFGKGKKELPWYHDVHTMD
jgi:NO-binding membrane sensor protein with MHYT domain